MKLQLTTIAAAIALSASAASWANQAPDYTHNNVYKSGGEAAFQQQGNIRSSMNGFNSLNINGTANVRETDHDQYNQTGSTVNSLQTGTEQYSRILQTGPSGGTWEGNNAYVEQGSSGSEKNGSIVEQRDGSYNTATVIQKGSGLNESRIVQSYGDTNTATVNQYGMRDQSDIIQYSGDNNTATVDQFGGSNNQSFIEQRNGDLNTAKVEQQQTETGSLSMVRQNGSAAIANHNQTGGSGNVASSYQW